MPSANRIDQYWYINLYDTSWQIKNFMDNHLNKKLTKKQKNDEEMKDFIHKVEILTGYFIENKRGMTNHVN